MHKGRPTSQLAIVKPTVENVISYNQYRRTQPMVNGVPMMNVPSSDAIVLFGGGRHILLGLLQFGKDDKKVEDVELFILSTGILLWFNQLGNGLEIPFESVVCHGSIKVSDTAPEGHRLELLLTLEKDKVLNQFFTGESQPSEPQETMTPDGLSPTLSSVELTLRPKYSMYDRHYNPDIENLFTFENFGVNRGDDMVDKCNEALALCLEMYKDPNYDANEDEGDEIEQDEDDAVGDENHAEAMFTSINDTWNRYANSGLADDLEC
ncbi:regulator of volume decrease after cellular swelling-domain-containing protein [Zygosaccharomyces rouxii]|nr:regulator of volume decrease after cellular swelling-domain-containing protein [Zygosaccharomyces rouxii]